MAILASTLWRAIAAPGHEVCRLEKISAGWRLQGTSVFKHAAGPACLSYSVQCDADWATTSGEVHGAIGSRQVDYVVARRGKSWTLNGAVVSGLERLADLDLGFTPATNTLPVRRAPLMQGETVELPAAWLDVDAGALTELVQTYERRSAATFWYEAPKLGYRGLLEFDANGLILRYPDLWEAESWR